MKEDQRASVLIVDDESINISLLAEFLSKDYQILFSTSGEEAIDIVRTQKPDLVLLDIGLPDIDGYEVCRRLKANQDTQNIPIVFSTAKDSTEDEVIGLNLGASDYITKPYNMDLVKARTRNQLRLKKKTDLLELLASLDGLTELPNRRYFDEHFEYEWRRAIRSGTSISIAMVDVDYFKGYNDHYGHSVGDECLQVIAQELAKTASRGTEFVARYGGEEFIFVWPEVAYDEAMKAAEVVRNSIEMLQIPHDKSPVGFVSVSMGVGSVSPKREDNSRALIENADELLYRAKSQGRNRVVGNKSFS